MCKNFPGCLGMRVFKVFSACLLLLVSSAISYAQTARDVPILISQDNSTRALSVDPARWRGRLPTPSQEVWYADDQTRVTLFLTSLNLMKEEGANAFRAYAEDASGRQFPLSVESMKPVAGYEWIHALTIRLNGQMGDAGDVLVRVTWRGMTSNRVRLGIGHLGGGPSDDPGAIPTGAPLYPVKLQDPYDPDQQLQRIGPQFSADRIRFMEQATFGATQDLDLRLRRIGISSYLQEQFDLPYPTIRYPTLPLMPSDPNSVPGGCTGDCLRDNYSMYLLQRWFFQEALYGKDQLRRRVAWALSQIFVVSGVDTQQPSYLLPYLQVIDRNAFGDFRKLLREMTLNPAMGNYLDLRISTKNNPNENYAREVLQLFSIGLYMLNQDGTLQLDQNHNPIPTYDQNVVNGFTKILTGWRLCQTQATCPNVQPNGTLNFLDDMEFVNNNHDTGSKLLLNGITQPANQTVVQDLDAAINNIFSHQNVPPFISKQLIQHLVTSDPTPAYVGRVAAVFIDNGAGVRGDLKAVVRAILTDPEARGDVKTDPNYGYLKEPVLFTTHILRQFNARAANGAAGSQSDGYINPQTINIGQDVFRAPTVFNYYPPDYTVPTSGILGPEFYLLTTSTSLRRANFGNTIIFNGIASTLPGSTNAPNGTSLDMSEMQALASADPSGALLIETLNKRLLHGTMSPEMRNIITTAFQAVPSTNIELRARTPVYLIATSSQYQVQR